MADPIETRPHYIYYPAEFVRSRSNGMFLITEILQKNLTPHISLFEVTGTDMDQSTTYDFLCIVTKGPHCTISKKNDDFGRKLQHFPTPCI